jgi:hypothetical protein
MTLSLNGNVLAGRFAQEASQRRVDPTVPQTLPSALTCFLPGLLTLR